MRIINLLSVLLSVMMLGGRLCLMAGLAQDSAVERDIINRFNNGQAQGLEIEIQLKDAGGGFSSTDLTREFKPGEEIRLLIESNVGGYLYIINRGSSGTNRLLFPIAGERNWISPRQPRVLPESHTMEFKEPAGMETLQVLLARRPLPYFAKAGRRLDGKLDQTANLAANRLWLKNVDAQKVGLIVGVLTDKPASSKAAALATRDPVLARRKNTYYVVASQSSAKRGLLRLNEVLPFGLRLRHGSGAP